MRTEQLERRASTAEQYAGALVTEVERKDADLEVAAAALEEAARQGGTATSPAVKEDPAGRMHHRGAQLPALRQGVGGVTDRRASGMPA